MYIKKGYIILARSMYESEISRKPPHFRELWIWLLIHANHAPRKSHGRTIDRGQIHTSTPHIISELRWYKGAAPSTYKKYEIENAMKAFRKAGMITTMKTGGGSLITICNYEHYQDANNYDSRNRSHIENSTNTEGKPNQKQELKNLNHLKNKNCVNTNIFSIDLIKRLTQEVSEELDILTKLGVADNIYDHYSGNDWKRNGGIRIESETQLRSIIKQWIKKDSGMDVFTGTGLKMPERFRNM